MEFILRWNLFCEFSGLSKLASDSISRINIRLREMQEFCRTSDDLSRFHTIINSLNKFCTQRAQFFLFHFKWNGRRKNKYVQHINCAIMLLLQIIGIHKFVFRVISDLKICIFRSLIRFVSILTFFPPLRLIFINYDCWFRESFCQMTRLVRIELNCSLSSIGRSARFIGNPLANEEIIFAVLRAKRRGCFGRLFGSRARRGRTTNLHGTVCFGCGPNLNRSSRQTRPPARRVVEYTIAPTSSASLLVAIDRRTKRPPNPRAMDDKRPSPWRFLLN